MTTSTKLLSKTPTGTYTVDPVKSTVVCLTKLLGFHEAPATLRLLSGTIDVIAPSAVSVHVTIDATSFNSYNKTRDEHAAAEFLDAGRYPEITYKADTVNTCVAGTTVAGILTVREIAMPVPLIIQSAEVIDKDLHLCAIATVDRFVFGVDRWKGIVARMLPVKITIVAQAHLAKIRSRLAAEGLNEKRSPINEPTRQSGFFRSTLL